MKKRVLSMLVALVLCLTLLPTAALATENETSAQSAEALLSTGSAAGTESDPILIGSLRELEAFRDRVNDGDGRKLCAQLTADITLGDSWTSISINHAYIGTFDGNGHTIYAEKGVANLFGRLGTNGKVQGLTVEIGTMTASSGSAVLVRENSGGTIERCSVRIYDMLTISSYFGLIAYENAGTIEHCRSSVSKFSASGSAKAAGIAYTNYKSGTIKSCYFNGKFRYDKTTGAQDYAITSSLRGGMVENCYCKNDVLYRKENWYLDESLSGVHGAALRPDDRFNYKYTLENGQVTWLLNNGEGTSTNYTEPWRLDEQGVGGTPTLDPADGRVTKSSDTYTWESLHTHTVGGSLHEFAALTAAPEGSGYYYLSADTTLSDTWNITGETVLCLNGKTLTTGGNAITVAAGGTLTLMTHDKKTTGGTVTGEGTIVALQGGTLVMQGGTISGGTTGVELPTDSTFRMEGGEITGCAAGVSVEGGNLTLSGSAKVEHNTQNILLEADSVLSFGNLNADAKFGVSLTNQGSMGASERIAVTDVTGGQYHGQLFADAFDSDGTGFDLYLSEDGKTVYFGKQTVHRHELGDADVTFLPWAKTDSLPTEGNYYLTRNVTLTQKVTLKNANICLNGYTITLSGSATRIYVGNNGSKNAAGALTDCTDKGTVTGGGVTVQYDSTFSFYNGTLNGTKTEITQSGGTFNMYGGKITGNTRGTVVGQSKTGGNQSAITINMYGGEISGNNISGSQGGGVFVGSGNQFNMYGGKIINNTTTEDGGGVYIAPKDNAYQAGTMTIHGDAVIQDNKANGVTNNVSLPNGNQITISGTLGENAKIGVTTQARLSAGTVNIATATDTGWVAAKNFTSDKSAYHVGLVNDGKTVQLQVHSHQWGYSVSQDGTTITAKCTAENCDLENGNGGSVQIVPPSGSLIYDGNEHTATVNKSQDWQGDTVAEADIKYTKDGDATFTGNPKDAGTYTASITVGEGKNAKTASVKYTIAQAELTIDSVTVASKTYNGSADAEITNVTFTGLKNSEALTKDTDYEVSGTFNSANVNEANKVTGTVTLKDTSKVKNYKLPITTYDVSATIAQAATPAAPTGLTGVKDQLLSTVSLAAHPGWSWADGAVSMSTAGPQNFNANYHDSNGNYADGTNVPVSVNVVNKTDTGVTITGLPQTVTYGDAFTLEAAQTGDTGTSGKWSWDFDGDYFQEKSTGGHQETLTLQAIKAGTPSKSITATYESGTHKGSATVNAVVEKKEVTVSGIAAENKEYDGGTTATVNASGATITGKVDGDKLTITATGTFADADAGENKTVTLTLGTLGGADSANYTLATAGNQTETKANITAKDVSISAVTVSDKDYSGNANATVASVTITGVSGALSMGTDFDVTSATFPDADADTANVDVTINVALKDTAANNYNLTNGMGYVVTSAAKINKAAYGGAAPTKTVNILKNYAGVQTGRLTAADFFTTAPAEAKITHAVPNSNPSSMMSLAGEDSSGNFTYASKKNITAASDESWTITISSKNYTDITATLTFSPVDRTDAGVTISSVPASKTYGESFTLTASVTDAGTGTGSWTWTSNDPSVLQVTGTGASATVKALKAGSATISAKYESDTTMGEQTTAPITVGKRVITVTADNKSMTVNGTLPTFTVTYGNLPSGVQAADIFGTMASASTTTDGKTTGSFDITVTTPVLKAEAGANYEVGAVTKGTLTVNPRSSSGGGGGSSVSTYSVTVGKTDNGSVSVSPKSASKGDTVTITVTPDKGYVLETLTVLDKNDKEIKLTEKNGKYTFTMPAGKVEVKATFMEDNSMLNFFMDVKAGDYFYDAVLWAAEKGITSGTDATHFSPNAACTRAQIVTFLWRAAGSPEPKGTGSFADVPADSYYTKAVAWAVENGITGGTGDGKFSPDATCTRAQAVTFLYRASGASAVSGNAAFSDVATNAYYAAAVKWAEKNGVTGGIGGGLFGSGNDCTRAQIVTFLYRTYQGK